MSIIRKEQLTNPLSASYAETASYALNASVSTINTGSLLTTASATLNNIQFTKGDGSTFNITVNTGSAATIDTSSLVTTSSFNAFTSSINAFTASYNTGSFSGSFTGSFNGTASWATNALTASYVNPLRQDVTITGSLLLTQSYISTVDYIDYRVIQTHPTHVEGRTHWLDDTKTLQIDTDVNNFSIEVGHQSVVRVRNTTGYDLAAGKVVYINGESGNRPTITTASWDGDPTSAATLGFVAQLIGDNQNGYVVTNGMLRGINTTAFTPGDQLYLSSSGNYTSTVPVSPKHEVRLGKVVTSANNGTIYVDIMNGYELGELHDVLINGSTNGDLVVKSGSLWINSKQLTGSYGLTGSLTATSFTGSIFGTSSWANNARTSSYILSSNVIGPFGQNSIQQATYATSLTSFASINQINIGDSSDVFIRPNELEQSKYATLNIYNYTNFT